ncbi:Tonsoku-like protein [Eumeta japonica]|uniref:Tonsoku-like protein n=1 Tax=Eumeta variegata TaxID=151549 RepID=A0A4C1TZ59_EUMVA|nr:Tonsoku-like protein [Eumeta japonica]
MEEEKLIKKKRKALNGSNRRNLAEACNDLATFYYKHNRFSDALDEYKVEASIYKEMGLRLEWATANRMIGEMYTMMAEFDKALKYEERHLSVAKELNNLVEEQRAMATLGRIYLLQGQSSHDKKDSQNSLTSAEKTFMKSLVLCEKLNGKINKHELMDMRARLLLNIGVVQEHLGFIDKAIDCIEKAIVICTNLDLFSVLHQCYMTEAMVYSNRNRDYRKALNCLNKALEVASRLEDKILKQCETLATKADILCKMSDYQSAKQVLYKAWKLGTPDEDEEKNIERNLKVVAAMCYTEELLISTNPSDHQTFKKLYEKLGDGACHLQHYSAAVEYYLKMLEQAELAGESGKKLIPIYVSLYQTYKDMGCYNDALTYYYKEYELIKDESKEAYTTLYSIAEALFLAKKPYDEIEKACLEAQQAVRTNYARWFWNLWVQHLLSRYEPNTLGDSLDFYMSSRRATLVDFTDKARNCDNKKYEIRVLKNLLIYQEEHLETDKMVETKVALKSLGYDEDVNFEVSDDDDSSTGSSDDDNTPKIGDDICLDDLTDLSENEEQESIGKREVRKRGKGFVIKKNIKGETQLHVASISGNKLLLERLLGNGHPVNIRDNAGWLPLHEACIHGHLEIANILIDHGAHINDRGGANCEGITPLYDAASNGHLDVVHLLLDKGAIPTVKTDFGETPLTALQKWRSSTILTKDEESQYKNLCDKIHSMIDKSPNIDLNRAKSKTPTKTPTKSPQHTSGNKSSKELCSPVFKRRNVINDESDEESSMRNLRNQTAFPSDDSDDSGSTAKVRHDKREGVKEYRNAILALRNRNLNDSLGMEIQKPKQKSALLAPEEVDDDWLEDDLGINKNKKRKISHEYIAPKRASYECVKDTIDSINKISPLKETNNVDMEKEKVCISDLIDISDNSSESENFLKNDVDTLKKFEDSFKNISDALNDYKSHDSRANMKKRWKRQSTLLKAGFQRQRDTGSNSSSDNECSKFQESVVLSRKSSNENFASTSNDPFGVIQNLNPNVVQPVNVIQPINIVQSNSGKLTQIMPPAAVKVQVEDKTLLISLNLTSINKQKIKWLAEVVQNRYYKLTGSRPVFTLMTCDGVFLSEDDPLSLVLATPSLKTSISSWKASPSEDRYIECCGALGVEPCNDIQQAIARSHTTHRLSLGINTLHTSQIRPLFRALIHQTSLTAIFLSNNNLGDEGMKYFSEYLELENIGVFGNVVGLLFTFLESAKDLKLRKFNLSNCKLADGQFMRVFRCLNRAKHLNAVTLRDNLLTFITLKKLLQRQPPVPQVNLEGCHHIFKYSPDSDFHCWLPNIDFGKCTPEINLTPVHNSDEERETFKVFSKIWLNCFKGRGIIEYADGGVTRFTAK